MRKDVGAAEVAAMRPRGERRADRCAAAGAAVAGTRPERKTGCRADVSGGDDGGKEGLCARRVRSPRTAKSYADLLREARAQGTVEYALTTVVFLSVMVACAALWRAAADGTLGRIAAQAASHVLDGSGAIDIALY